MQLLRVWVARPMHALHKQLSQAMGNRVLMIVIGPVKAKIQATICWICVVPTAQLWTGISCHPYPSGLLSKYCGNLEPFVCTTGIILGMGQANGRRGYIVTPPFIGRAHTQNDLYAIWYPWEVESVPVWGCHDEWGLRPVWAHVLCMERIEPWPRETSGFRPHHGCRDCLLVTGNITVRPTQNLCHFADSIFFEKS